MRIKTYFWGLGLTLAFCQCQTPDVTTTTTRTFFDLTSFVKQQTDSLTNAKIGIQKTIRLNGLSESRQIATPNWEVEFAELVSSNINRPALIDKYDVTQNDTETIYTLKANQKSEVQKLSILAGNASTIVIEKGIDNLLNTSTKEIRYNTKEGLQIKSVRKSIFRPADTLFIRTVFQ